MDTLFDLIPPTDDGFKRTDESRFKYLNRSSREEVRAARVRIDRWFNEYPKEHRARLAAQLKSTDDDKHLGAFWELLLHHWMLHQRLNPQVNSSTPDFWIDVGNERVAVEATTTHFRSSVPIAEMDKLPQLLAELKSSTHDLFYDVDTEEDNSYVGPFGKKHFAQIAEWVNQLSGTSPLLDIDTYVRFAPLKLNGVVFHCFDKQLEMLDIDSGFIQAPYLIAKSKCHERIRRAIKDKASDLQEGCINIIAINVFELHMDDIDVENALFGDEQVVLSQYNDGRRDFYIERNSRANNGSLGTAKNRKYQRVSGVLVGDAISSSTELPATCHLFENPAAVNEIPELLGQNRETVTAWGGETYFRRSINLQ